MGSAEEQGRAVDLLRTAMFLERTLTTVPLAKTLIESHDQTIAAAVGSQTSAGRVRMMLARATQRRSEVLELGEVLGEGGMGVVRSARQAALGRNVAVKKLRPEISSESAMIAMLREAWVTGTLEHPNIVPVYYVDTDSDGEPLIILKRIEGVAWSTLMEDAEAVRERFGATDLLEWNIGVLEQVLNAMRYAHSRGVVHRDLKPDNVMVGEFGEVYVVDWGIAVSLHDDGETLLPLASEQEGVAGTPSYMAPEMLVASVSEQTDVYQIGAILYQIITGHAPHRGSSLTEIVASIQEFTPVFPEDSSEDLCHIARTAMAAEPGDRYASVEAMRRALNEFVEHRGSLRLSQRAVGYLESLQRLAREHARPEALQELLGECRFGFQSALESWPDNAVAQQGLASAIELVAEVELERGDPRVAASILRELDDPCQRLAGRVGDAVEALDRADARHEKLGQHLDKQVGRRARVVIVTVLGSIWIAMELWAQLTGTIESAASHSRMAIGSLAFLALHLCLLYWARNTLMKTQINRQFGAAFSVLLICQAMISAVAPNIGMTPVQVQVLWMLIWTAIATLIATAIERRLWPLAAGTGICFVVASLWMDYRIYAMMVTTAVMIVNVAAIWWPDSKSSDSPK